MGLPGVPKGDPEVNEVPVPVVCLPVSGWHDQAIRCLAALLRYTPATVPIVVADDADPDDGLRRWAATASDGVEADRITWRRSAAPRGFPAAVTAIAREFSHSDLVLLDNECAVTSGWLPQLRAAATATADVATATALLTPGGLALGPHDADPDAPPPGDPMIMADTSVGPVGTPWHPEVPGAGHRCAWIRRSALDLVCGLRYDLPTLEAMLIDFSQRCRARGLRHVLADDVLVRREPRNPVGTPDPEADATAKALREHEPGWRTIRRVAADAVARGDGHLGRALMAAARVGRPLTVTIDGDALAGPPGEEQFRTLQTIRGLARREDLRLRVLVPRHLGPEASEVLATTSVELVERQELRAAIAGRRAELDDVAYRASPVRCGADLAVLLASARRMVLVLAQPALPSPHDPGGAAAVDAWRQGQGLTADAAALADRVIFASWRDLEDARARDLVPPGRGRVINEGEKRLATAAAAPPQPWDDVSTDLVAVFEDALRHDRPASHRFVDLSPVAGVSKRNRADVAGPRTPCGDRPVHGDPGTGAAPTAMAEQRRAVLLERLGGALRRGPRRR